MAIKDYTGHLDAIRGTGSTSTDTASATAQSTPTSTSQVDTSNTQTADTSTQASKPITGAERWAQLMGEYSNANTAAATAANTATEEAAPKATMNSPTTLLNNTGTSTSTATGTMSTYTPTGMYDPANLEAYNRQRESDLRSLYDTAQQSTLAGLKTAYDQNLSTAQAARDQINPQYQSSANALSAEYERQRRNNNMQANLNGLNTGAGSQMALAQSANYQANQAGLARQQNLALDQANRAIADLQMNYQNAIAEATANNNYQKAAALLDEYENAYNRQMAINDANYTRAWNEDERNYSRTIEEASNKAQYGDFSGYAALYGNDIASAMELTWALQNPQIAWAAGKLSAEDYYALTGQEPSTATGNGYGGIASGSTYLGGGRFSDGTTLNYKGGYSSGGYSASRDRAYRGPALTGTGTGTDATGKYTLSNTNNLPAYTNLGGIHSALGTSPASSSSDTSSSGGGTTYGNIGNNKLVVGGTQR